ncbi:MAG: acetate--CoA ligase family protein [Candidatus Accumulibacter sp.]|jgi:acetyl-CoA synthetase (ADP-forming)|nr:acetate--CoA ligase family protein [Accumulibacter sp.]
MSTLQQHVLAEVSSRPINVERILYPRSVAVIGASEDTRKFGGRICKAVVHHRFGGAFFPINPARDEIFGVPVRRHISEVETPVDLALVAVPARQLPEVIRDCGEAGVGACVVITARMEEFDEAGAALQENLVELARRYGMRLIGPNCMGLVNVHHRLALSSTATLTSFPEFRKGGVGLVSQSGGLLGALLALAHTHGVGFSSLVTVGNQADLGLCDFLEYLVEDPATTTICLYVEAFKDAARFRALALKAREKGKPVLVVKAGRTAAGQTLARSHTASLAGTYEAFAALAEAAGVLVLDEPGSMILAAGFLDKSRARLRPGQSAISVLGSSGGGSAVIADRLALADIPLGQWRQETREKLEAHYLSRHIHNPIDLGNRKSNQGFSALAETIDAIAEDPETGIVSYLFTPQPMMRETAETILAAWRRGEKPFLVIADLADYVPEVRSLLVDSGIPVVSRVDDALRIFSAVKRWLAQPRREAAAPEAGGRIPPRLPALPAGQLTEPETKALLAAYGIRVNREARAENVEAALSLAETFRYPVVLKGVSREAIHKSDLGLVHLGLEDEAALRRAFAALTQEGARFREFGIVVAEQVGAGEPVTEVVLGCRHDAEYGPLVLVGFGGIHVEYIRDFAVALAPLSPADARSLVEKLRLYPLLDGARNRPRADVEALVEALVHLSWLAHDLGPRLLELDVNPILVGAAGKGAVAVDGRATLALPLHPSSPASIIKR